MKIKLIQYALLIIAGLGGVVVFYLKSVDNSPGSRGRPRGPGFGPQTQAESALTVAGQEFKVSYTEINWGPMTFSRLERAPTTFGPIATVNLPMTVSHGETVVPSGEYYVGIETHGEGQFSILLGEEASVRGNVGPPLVGRIGSIHALVRRRAQSMQGGPGPAGGQDGTAERTSAPATQEDVEEKPEADGTYKIPLKVTDSGTTQERLSIEFEIGEQSETVLMVVRYGPKVATAELKIVGETERLSSL